MTTAVDGSGLPAEWELWAAGNLIRGRPADELVAALEEEGFAPEAARSAVTTLEGSAGVRAARLALRPVVQVHRLRREHLRLAGSSVPVQPGVDPATFVQRYLAPQVPVVLPDLTAGWPAREWTWSSLVERFGDTAIEVCEGRSRVDGPARQWRSLTRLRPFRQVVERALDPATGDDLYVVANNAALEGPDRSGGPLASLVEDVRAVDGFLARETLLHSSVWIGGAGTHTPVHHDLCDLLFCPFLGAKDVWLAPPEEIELADHGAGYFGPDLSLARPETWARFGIEALAVRQVRVEPGQTLLIPAGWWHEVVSRAPCVTITFAGLTRPNDYGWFHPAPPERVELGAQTAQEGT